MTAPDLKEPCGECYLPSRETCDICGAIGPSPKVIASLPERIWTASTNGKCHVGFDTPSLNYTNEYVRADLAHPAPLAEALAVPTDAARDVLAERARQVSAEGWTPEHDDAYQAGDLADAAACYARGEPRMDRDWTAPREWPWAASWWKPTDRRRDLVKAGALILAEIERLDRAALRAIGEGGA